VRQALTHLSKFRATFLDAAPPAAVLQATARGVGRAQVATFHAAALAAAVADASVIPNEENHEKRGSYHK
jgi:hypothetical protein